MISTGNALEGSDIEPGLSDGDVHAIRRYLKAILDKAIPHLTRITIHKGKSLYLVLEVSIPAMVMKMLEMVMATAHKSLLWEIDQSSFNLR